MYRSPHAVQTRAIGEVDAGSSRMQQLTLNADNNAPGIMSCLLMISTGLYCCRISWKTCMGLRNGKIQLDSSAHIARRGGGKGAAHVQEAVIPQDFRH